MTKQTNWLCAQRSLRVVWSESLLCARWAAEDLSFLRADSEDSDQTGRMPRLICLRWAHSQFVGFVVRRLIRLLNELIWFTLNWGFNESGIEITNERLHDKTNKVTLRQAKTDQPGQCLSCPLRCPGWSESSLYAHATLLILSWGGSNSSSTRCFWEWFQSENLMKNAYTGHIHTDVCTMHYCRIGKCIEKIKMLSKLYPLHKTAMSSLCVLNNPKHLCQLMTKPTKWLCAQSSLSTWRKLGSLATH